MKTVKIEKTPTSFFIPADHLRAAFQCVSKEQTRYYLGGVFVVSNDGVVKLVGLDGHVMIVLDLPEPSFVGCDCETQSGGFIIETDPTDKAFKAKVSSDDLWAYGDTTTGILQIVVLPSDGDVCQDLQRVGVCEFARIDGTFPDWARVQATAKSRGDASDVAFNPVIFSKLVKASDVFEKGKAIRMLTGKSDGDPIRVEFESNKNMIGTLMPYRWDA